jgi:hypothetical protein
LNLKENANHRRSNSISEIPQKASLKELSDDEIILAYNRIQVQKQQQQQQQMHQQQPIDESYQEYLKWKEMNQKLSTIKENIIAPPMMKSSNDEKVIEELTINNDSSSSSVSVVKNEQSNVTDNENFGIINESLLTESDNDFDEFKDTIEDESNFLTTELVIKEEGDEFGEVKSNDDDEQVKEESKIIIIQEEVPLKIEEEAKVLVQPIEIIEAETELVVNAKLTLSNEPLKILTTSLSSSSVSLASEKSSYDENKKRPACHKKGKAPQPPSSSNVNENFYFDELTNRYFKETEL